MNKPRRNPHLQTSLGRRLSRQMARTVTEFGLLQDGDHVMVCLSGGKDSYTLYDLLFELRRRAPVNFELTAVHLDQVQPGYDGAPLRRWLEAGPLPFEIVREDTYTKVVELVPEGKSFCSACSRMRRGILYRTAERLGCNKIALGHHRDDALETLLMNLFYAGKLQAMPATYRTDDGRFEVIRPMVECAEKDIIAHAEASAYPILPCNLCGSQSGLRRDAMTALLDELERDNPNVRSIMLHALRKVHPSHLLDKDVAKVWLDRSDDATPDRPRSSDPVPDPLAGEATPSDDARADASVAPRDLVQLRGPARRAP